MHFEPRESRVMHPLKETKAWMLLWLPTSKHLNLQGHLTKKCLAFRRAMVLCLEEVHSLAIILVANLMNLQSIQQVSYRQTI